MTFHCPAWRCFSIEPGHQCAHGAIDLLSYDGTPAPLPRSKSVPTRRHLLPLTPAQEAMRLQIKEAVAEALKPKVKAAKIEGPTTAFRFPLFLAGPRLFNIRTGRFLGL